MKRIVCIGDSNTFGYDPRDIFGGRYPAERRWTGLLGQAGWEVWNAGQNGREIPNRDRAIQALLRELERAGTPDWVTVMLGSNDLLQGFDRSAEDVAERMERFLRRLRPRFPAAHMLLIAPPPMAPGAWVGEPRLLLESARLGPCYAALAERLGIGFVDARTWDVELSFDGVHFSEQGHAAFAAGLLRALAEDTPAE